MNIPRMNLIRDGYEAVAEYVSRIVNKRKGLHNLYVAMDGAVRIAAVYSYDRQRPVSELVGTFRKGILVEEIEDALLEHLREINAHNTKRAA